MKKTRIEWLRRVRRFGISAVAGTLFGAMFAAYADAQSMSPAIEREMDVTARAVNSISYNPKKNLPIVEGNLKKSEQRLSPYPEYHYFWGEIYGWKKDTAAMDAAFRKGIGLGGSAHDIAGHLGTVLYMGGDPKTVAGIAQTALDKWKGDAELTRLLKEATDKAAVKEGK